MIFPLSSASVGSFIQWVMGRVKKLIVITVKWDFSRVSAFWRCSPSCSQSSGVVLDYTGQISNSYSLWWWLRCWLCLSWMWTVSNILTLRGFALSCDSHISFLLLPLALSNLFCCGKNMEFLWKFNYRSLWRFCKQRHISCVSTSPSALKVNSQWSF